MGHFHLINSEAVRFEGQSLVHGLVPFFRRVAEHPRDEIHVDLIEADLARPAIRAEDLGRLVGTSVQFQNRVVEMLDAQAQAGHADRLDGFELAPFERSRLALESYFARMRPAKVFGDTLDQTCELFTAQKGGRSAAKVDEVKRPIRQGGAAAVEGALTYQGIAVDVDVLRILVRVDAEIAELAALAAEWNVDIQPQRRARYA